MDYLRGDSSGFHFRPSELVTLLQHSENLDGHQRVQPYAVEVLSILNIFILQDMRDSFASILHDALLVQGRWEEYVKSSSISAA